MSADDILDGIAGSLTAAATSGRDRHAIEPAMLGFESLAKLVQEGKATWDHFRPWAAAHAEDVARARFALEEWSLWMGQEFRQGGEEGAERALLLRSQLEFARTVFAGTSALETLEVISDEEGDVEFRHEAERRALDPPDFVPRSHVWWRWTNGQ